MGEIAIYDDFLADEELELHGQGVSALCIRPEALVFYWDGASSVAWLPRTDTFLTLTAGGTPTLVADDYELEIPGLDEEGMEFSPPAATYGSWGKIGDMAPGAAAYLDPTAVNGVTYQYSLVSVDTSGNRSAMSSASVDVTPAAGIAGPPRIARMPGGAERALRARRGRVAR